MLVQQQQQQKHISTVGWPSGLNRFICIDSRLLTRLTHSHNASMPYQTSLMLHDMFDIFQFSKISNPFLLHTHTHTHAHIGKTQIYVDRTGGYKNDISLCHNINNSVTSQRIFLCFEMLCMCLMMSMTVQRSLYMLFIHLLSCSMRKLLLNVLLYCMYECMNERKRNKTKLNENEFHREK